MPTASTVVLFLLSILLPSSSALTWQSNDELQALLMLAIKQDWGNPTALHSWKNPTASTFSSPCGWVGVACNENGQVTALSFQNFQISTPIPASICNLNLSYLDFSYNNFTQEFPTALYSCSVLQYLDLSNNAFSGALPADINKLSSELEHLNLSSNGFIGRVPSAIAGFPKLKSLLLDTNSFGSYPAAAMGNMVEIEMLILSTNPFSPGPIPHEIGKLTKMKMLVMSGMRLTGGIPDSLLPLTELMVLDLSQNNLHGEIPGWLWKHQKLKALYLADNKLIGGIGRNISANMLSIDLSKNRLTQPIPETIGMMTNLSMLLLKSNNITGHIPSSLGLLPNLEVLAISNNMLSGPLPPELGKHSLLMEVRVGNNFLTGELPDTLCFNKMLFDIWVPNNSFSGVFPANLWECNTLKNILIQNNDFTGVLPAALSSKISRIEMGNNRFSGAIPASATGLRVFKAENNWFSRALPADMSNLASLTELSLAGNDISGCVPQSIVALKRLAALNLSRNQISGVIPASIGQLPVLTILDLSNNNLVGDLPVTFNNLHPSFLNLSFNQLTGMVPATLQVTSFNGSFLGNRGLCTGRLESDGLMLPLCPGDEGYSSSTRRKILLAVLIPSVALVGSVAVGWFVARRKNKQRAPWKMVPFRHLSFTVHDVISKISQENVIGRGGSGMVHLIHLDCQNRVHGGDEAARQSTVAVKKIGNAGKPDASLNKEFEAEVTSLCGLRHGNIISMLCCITSEDTKLIVYEYMENGSLDRWLHRRRHGADDVPGPLDWSTRLGIALDVARGLRYMHHDFTRPVIHRDIKCSNILLDYGFRAKIADFGLARILSKSGESEVASAVCGTFGYIAPEYVDRAEVSPKVDVYSFGVVLLELATGRGPTDGSAESGSCLAKWAAKRYKDGDQCADLVDSEIKDAAYLKDMVAMFELGMVCTAEDPSSRPTMSDVLQQLLRYDRIYGMSGDDDAARYLSAADSMECTIEMSIRT